MNSKNEPREKFSLFDFIGSIGEPYPESSIRKAEEITRRLAKARIDGVCESLKSHGLLDTPEGRAVLSEIIYRDTDKK